MAPDGGPATANMHHYIYLIIPYYYVHPKKIIALAHCYSAESHQLSPPEQKYSVIIGARQVSITYYTACADETGALQPGKDIYWIGTAVANRLFCNYHSATVCIRATFVISFQAWGTQYPVAPGRFYILPGYNSTFSSAHGTDPFFLC